MRKIYIIIYILIIAVFLWIAGTSSVYRIKNPTKTETEAFLHTAKSFVLDFEQ